MRLVRMVVQRHALGASVAFARACSGTCASTGRAELGIAGGGSSSREHVEHEWVDDDDARVVEQAARENQETGYPERCRGYDYFQFTRPDGGADHPVFCRRPVKGQTERDGATCGDEVLVDVHALARASGYARLRDLRVSRCDRYVAYIVALKGDDDHGLYILDTACGLRSVVHGGGVGECEWAADGMLLYTRVCATTLRPRTVHRHLPGTASSSDTVVYEETAKERSVALRSTKDGRYVLVTVLATRAAQVILIDGGDSAAPPRVVTPWAPNVQYTLEHHGGWLYALVDAASASEVTNRLLRTPAEARTLPPTSSWQVVMESRPNVVMEAMDMFDTGCVLYEREHGVSTISVMSMHGSVCTTPRRVTLPGGDCRHVAPGHNSDFSATAAVVTGGSGIAGHFGALARISYRSISHIQVVRQINAINAPIKHRESPSEVSSPVLPPAVYSVCLADHTVGLQHRRPLAAPLKALELTHECRREHATAPDGTRVPVTVAHRRGLVLDGSHTLRLLVYGAYGIPLETAFDMKHAMLLSRGVVLAWAHVRGGGELGPAWHAAACHGNKQVSADDLAACAQHVVSRGYTRPARMAAAAHSAGGAILTSAATRWPALFRTLLLRAPMTAVATTMRRPQLPLSVEEYDEWGDPHDPAQRIALDRFCAVESMASMESAATPSPAPAFLIQASLGDARVPAWGMLRWATQMRRRTRQLQLYSGCGSQPPMVLTMSDNGDHLGSAMDDAVGAAFMLKVLRQRA